MPSTSATVPVRVPTVGSGSPSTANRTNDDRTTLIDHSTLIDRTTLIDVVFPESANHYGTLFGGRALELLGRAAFVGATRAVRHRLVMASCSEIEFLSPVQTGEIIELVATVRLARKRSLTVDVVAHAEELLTGRRRPAVHGTFDMVAVDENGRPATLVLPIHRQTEASSTRGGESNSSTDPNYRTEQAKGEHL